MGQAKVRASGITGRPAVSQPAFSAREGKPVSGWSRKLVEIYPDVLLREPASHACGDQGMRIGVSVFLPATRCHITAMTRAKHSRS